MPADRPSQRKYKASHRELLLILDRVLPGRVQRDVVFLVPADRVEAGDTAPSATIPEHDLRQLEQEIWSYGLEGPFLARQLEGGRYDLVAEHEVFHAAMRAGLARIRLLVLDLDEAEVPAIEAAVTQRPSQG